MQKYRHKKIHDKVGYLNSKIKIIKLIMSFVLFLAFVFLAFLIFKVFTLEKFAYVNNNEGNVEIIIVDALKDKYTKSLIKKDFIVESSRNYGQYEIGKLWILGMKDNFRGKLVAETVTKNFAMPIYLWKDGRYSNLNLFQIIKSSIVQKQLFEYDYTLKTTDTPDSVLINFASGETTPAKLEIVDLTGSNNLAEIIVNILGVYGVKTTSYSKGYDKYLDCEVGGIDKDLIEIVSKIFSCQEKLDDGEVDLKIRIGKAFADRF